LRYINYIISYTKEALLLSRKNCAP